MHIVELVADNFKRLRAIRLAVGKKGVIEIAGNNAQGKTSVIDAVWAALGGEKAAPDKPIRDGANRAEVYLDLGDIKVTRKWTMNERSQLVVESADGTRLRSPQAVLDELVGRLSFDPLMFARLDADKQAATLRQIAGLDFADLEKRHQTAYDNRTLRNREMKILNSQLAAIPVAVERFPDSESSVSELTQEQQKMLAVLQENNRKREAVERNEQLVADGRKEVERIEAELKSRQATLERRERQLQEAEEAAFGLVDPDLTAITTLIREAETTNASVREKKKRHEIAATLRTAAAEVDALARELENVAEEKRARLEAARFPVSGLSVDNDTVTFNDQPFKQASTAQQIRVGLAIGAALNPKLRVILVREGSALDKESLSEVARWAEENDMQVFLERVGDKTTATGVVIEDGEIKG
jgi:DNA repair exonuclease SbcCD ATPase subunit